MTFIQRFGSALNLTPHFHVLVLDGVYAAEEGEVPRFYPLRPPDKSDVMAVATRVAERAAVWMETQESSEDGIEEPELGALYNALIMGRIASGPNAGRRVKTMGQTTAAMDSGEDELPVRDRAVCDGVGVQCPCRSGNSR